MTQNWKARLSAYTDVIAKSAKTASDTDPFFRPFVSDGALLSVMGQNVGVTNN
jgi:cytoskeleton-associated protein 5